MSSIDERVVEMKFQNSEFQNKVKGTLDSLKGLKDNLKLDGAANGLAEAGRGIGNFQSMIGGISNSFSSLQAVAFGAFASIGAKAVATGTQLLNSLSLAPVMQGFEEYETNMNSIQTILSNTKAAGTGLTEVNAALDEMNHYSDDTIYNFSEMARNVGTFTAAGVDLDTATGSIKGIANLAALSGSSSEQAAGAMYQLSQEIAAGKVTLMGWNSVVNAGMGGSVFQRALAETAVAMGEIDAGALTLEGDMKNVKIAGESFRDSISAEGGGESWLTSEVLTNTLQQFTGDLNEAELAAQGFTAEQIKAIQSQATMAVGAATEVKTLSGLMDTLKEGVASGWSQTFRILVGDFEEAKELFTGISFAVGGFFGRISESRNELLTGWKELGGRTVLIEGIKEAFWALAAPIAQVGQAFQQIFPKATAQDLYNFTVAFRDFFLEIQPSAETLDRLKRTFAGLFAILGIGWEILKAFGKFIIDLFRGFTEGDQGILRFTASIGDFLVGLHGAIKEGQFFTKFFDKLRDIIFKIVNPIRDAGQAIGRFFEGKDTAGGITDALGRVGGVTENLGEIADDAAAAWERFTDFIRRAAKKLQPFFEGVGNFFSTIGGAIGDFLSSLSFGDILAGVGTASAAVLVNSIRKFLGNFSLAGLFGGGESNNGPGFLENITDALDSLKDTLGAMQNALNAGALLAIATAIGILTLSVMALSKIPAGDLYKAISAIATLVTELAAAAWVFAKFKMSDTVKIMALGIGLTFLAVAIRILASAAKTLAELDWNELAKGVSGVLVLILALAGAVKLMSGSNTTRIIRTGIALGLLAIAVRILVESVEALQELNWESLAQGIAGVAVLLAALALFTRFARTNSMGIRSGAGLILLATSILILGEAVEKIQKLDWHQLARGMAGFAVALGIMVIALRKMPRTAIADGVTLILISTSMLIVGEALEKLAELNWENVGKSMLLMGGALGAIAWALKIIPAGAVFSSIAVVGIAVALLIIGEALEKLGAMNWANIGAALVQLGVVMGIIGLFIAFASTGVGAVAMITLAASLIIIAGAIYIMSLALERMGAMSWSDIGAALGQLALLFVILAIGGALSPLILLLAVALGVLAGALLIAGTAIYLAGEGIESFADAITKLSGIDAEALQNVVDVIQAMLELIPELAESAALGIVEFVATLGEHAPQMSTAFGAIIIAFAERIATDTPIIVQAFGQMMVKTLTSLADFVPKMVTAAASLLVGFLTGIAREMPKVAAAGTAVVVAMMRAIGDNTPKIVQEAFMMVIKVITGITVAISQYGPLLRNAASALGDAIIDGITGGINGGGGKVSEAASGVAFKALASANNALGIKSPSKKFMEVGKYAAQGLAIGLQGNRKQIGDAVNTMLGKLKEAMTQAKSDADKARESLHKLYEAREKDWRAINKQNAALAQANSEYAKASAAHSNLSKHLAGHTAKLKVLADQSDKTSARLEAANEKLEDARKTRDDYLESVKDDYNDLPELTGKTNLEKYMYDFQKQIVDTQKFAAGIQELRRRGLNDTMYKELLAKGPEAMPFIQQLLDQGVAGVTKLNKLGAALDKEAETLAKKAASSLYQAGVDAAKGLVDGLMKEQSKIEAYMNWLATIMVKSVKKQLGIRSPSKVFEEIGKQTIQGFTEGLGKSASEVTKSADSVGLQAINSMRKTLSGLGDAISGEMDLTPVVSPVLDLNAVRKDASLLSSMLAVNPIDIQSQVDRAKDAAAGLRDNQIALEELAVIGSGEHIEFTQNNYSPKALSSADIYRQTNNQLSRAKGALAT